MAGQEKKPRRRVHKRFGKSANFADLKMTQQALLLLAACWLIFKSDNLSFDPTRRADVSWPWCQKHRNRRRPPRKRGFALPALPGVR